MGDAADMILDGILDEQTGEYIGEAVGYPRTLNSRTINRKYNHVQGVTEFLIRIGYKTKQERIVVITGFLNSIDVKHDNISKIKMCSIISDKFNSFRKYCSLNP